MRRSCNAENIIETNLADYSSKVISLNKKLPFQLYFFKKKAKLLISKQI